MVAVLDPVITLSLVDGLAGLDEFHNFRMITTPDDVVCWLESVDDPAIALPCADAFAVLPNYSIEIPDETVDALDIRSASDVRVFLVVQHWDEPYRTSLSANGPIVVNTYTGLAQQLMVPGAGRIRI
jgi:flagellar assembly factor FliW